MSRNNNLLVIEGDLTEDFVHTGDLRIKGNIAQDVCLTVENGRLHVEGSVGDEANLGQILTGAFARQESLARLERLEQGDRSPVLGIQIEGNCGDKVQIEADESIQTGDVGMRSRIASRQDVVTRDLGAGTEIDAMGNVRTGDLLVDAEKGHVISRIKGNGDILLGDLHVQSVVTSETGAIKAGSIASTSRLKSEGGDIHITGSIGENAKVQADSIYAVQVADKALLEANENILITSAANEVHLSARGHVTAETIGDKAKIIAGILTVEQLGNHADVASMNSYIGTAGEGLGVYGWGNRFQADKVGADAKIVASNIEIGSLGDRSELHRCANHYPGVAGKAVLGEAGEGVVFNIGEVTLDGKPMEPTATMREARRQAEISAPKRIHGR